MKNDNDEYKVILSNIKYNKKESLDMCSWCR